MNGQRQPGMLPLLLFWLGMACISFLLGLGAYPLMDNNEGLYAETPREMLATGDYVLPHLNGVPYIEKPPLLYWLIAGSYRLFGISETSARLVPGMAALLTGLALIVFLWRLVNPAAAVLAGVMWVTSPGIVALGRTVLFDMLLTLMLSLTLMSFYLWLAQKRRVYLRLAYIAMALAVLTKGFLAMALVGLSLAVFLAWRASSCATFGESVGEVFRGLVGMVDPIGIALALVVAVPWHVLACAQDEGFAWFYFMNEHVLRFLGMREPHDYHAGAIYHYLPWVLAATLPWCLLLPVFVRRPAAAQAADESALARARDLRKFLASWFLTFLFFFSASQCKADYYMTTAIPPLMALLAMALQGRVKLRGGRLLPAVVTVVTVGVTIGMVVLAAIPSAKPYAREIVRVPLWGLLALAGLCSIGSWLARARRPLLFPCLAFMALWIVFIIGAVGSARARQEHTTTKQIAETILARDPSARIYIHGRYEMLSTLVFYVGRPLPMLDSTSMDLAYGEKSRDRAGLFMTMDEFRRLPPDPSCYVVVRTDDVKTMQKADLVGLRVLQTFARSAIYVPDRMK